LLFYLFIPVGPYTGEARRSVQTAPALKRFIHMMQLTLRCYRQMIEKRHDRRNLLIDRRDNYFVIVHQE
jgi:hypothetical protein